MGGPNAQPQAALLICVVSLPKIPVQTLPAELKLCTSFSYGSSDGICYSTIASGGYTFNLRPDGKGISLEAVQGIDCSRCTWGKGRRGRACLPEGSCC